MSELPYAADAAEIEGTLDTFFAAFTTGPGCAERLDALPDLFVPGAVVVRTCGGAPLLMSVAEFVAPRRDLLLGGGLTDFREWRTGGRLDVFGDVAAWFGPYAKSGVQDGLPFAGAGMKSVQLVRTGDGWRISAAVWDDERDGVRFPPLSTEDAWPIDADVARTSR